MTDDELFSQLLASDSAAERREIADRFDEPGAIDDEEFLAFEMLLRTPSSWQEPAADLEDRIMASILAETLTAALPSASAATAPPVVAPVIDLAERRARRSRPAQAATWLLSVAAAAALLFGAATVDRPKPRFDQQFALAATDLAPTATAAVKTRKNDTGTRIEIEITGLPTLKDGEFFQAWVKGPSGLVPIGTFSQGGKVVLWSGVPLDRYNTMTVTIEPEDGDPASSGRKVLAGPVPPPKG